MSIGQTTLSLRGAELAAGPSIRAKFSTITSDPYDPDTNPDGFINLGTSENYIMLPEVTEFVEKNLKLANTNFSYGEGPGGTGRLRKGMARHMDKYFNTYEPVNADDILFANGVTSLCEMLGFTIADAEDGILFSRPTYQSFHVDFGMKAKVKCVYTNFEDVDQFSPAAVQKYEQALQTAESNGVHIRALMLCNPHNPLGQCYPKETIIALMTFCDKHKIHLLCDEIYAASVYDVPDKHAVKFTSVLSFDNSEYIHPDFLHVLYGISKDLGAGGLRLGCIYIRNKELMRAMSSIAQFHWSGGPSQEIATLMLDDVVWLDSFLQLGREKLASANKLTRKILEDAGIEYHRGSNAGFFLWIDLSPYLTQAEGFTDQWQREAHLVQQLSEKKVHLTDGKSMSAEKPGWFRIIFSQDERVIKEGMKRVFEVIGK